MPQRPRLFAASIAENVRLGRPDASPEELLEAVANAGLLDVIARLPRGIDTVLGERGAGLSAGERQRIALARAFLRDAPLLLLDEPTANLDGATEEEVLESVARLREGRTTVIAAHRPALVALADRVLPLGLTAACGVMRTGGRGRPPRARRASRPPCPEAPLVRTLELARPAAGRLTLATLLGAGALAAGIGLIATSAWLISRASQHPQESALALAIVGVQFFGALARPVPLLRAARRPRRRLPPARRDARERLSPARGARAAGLPAFRERRPARAPGRRRGCAAGSAAAGAPPFAIAALVGGATVTLVWLMLPSAGADPARGAAARRHARALADRSASPAARSPGRPPPAGP